MTQTSIGGLGTGKISSEEQTDIDAMKSAATVYGAAIYTTLTRDGLLAMLRAGSESAAVDLDEVVSVLTVALASALLLNDESPKRGGKMLEMAMRALKPGDDMAHIEDVQDAAISVAMVLAHQDLCDDEEIIAAAKEFRVKGGGA